MRISYYTLIVTILTLVTLALILAITGVFSATTTDDTNMCAASVFTRATLVDSALPANNLECTTEFKNLRSSEQAVRNDLVDAYDRCARSFQAAFDKPIIRSEASFCHVCGLYTPEQAVTINNFSDDLYSQTRTYLDLPEQLATQDLLVDEQMSVIFFQDRTDEFSLLTLLMPKEWTVTTIAAAVGVTVGATVGTVVTGGVAGPVLLGVAVGGGAGAGGYIAGNLMSDPDGMIASGIVIRAHNQDLIDQIGCTTLNPDEI